MATVRARMKVVIDIEEEDPPIETTWYEWIPGVGWSAQNVEEYADFDAFDTDMPGDTATEYPENEPV